MHKTLGMEDHVVDNASQQQDDDFIRNAMTNVNRPHHAIKQSDDAWKMRAMLGILGQAVMLTGTAMERHEKGKGGLDVGDVGFAAFNLLANCIALHYGSSHRNDTHQLTFIKEQIDGALADFIPGGVAAAHDPTTPQRERHRNPLDQFLYEHASRISIGMRYAALANKLIDGINTKNPNKINGMTTAAIGKTIGLTQYTQSPYDDHQPTWLESIRQHSFNTGAMIESGVYAAYGLQALEAYQKDHKSWQLVKTLAYGIYVSCFAARMSASLDTLELDTEAVTQHISERLKQVPPALQHKAIQSVQQHLNALPEMEHIDLGVNTLIEKSGLSISFPDATISQQAQWDKAIYPKGETRDTRPTQAVML